MTLDFLTLTNASQINCNIVIPAATHSQTKRLDMNVDEIDPLIHYV
jgi:hypothetical protein